MHNSNEKYKEVLAKFWLTHSFPDQYATHSELRKFFKAFISFVEKASTELSPKNPQEAKEKLFQLFLEENQSLFQEYQWYLDGETRMPSILGPEANLIHYRKKMIEEDFLNNNSDTEGDILKLKIKTHYTEDDVNDMIERIAKCNKDSKGTCRSSGLLRIEIYNPPESANVSEAESRFYGFVNVASVKWYEDTLRYLNKPRFVKEPLTREFAVRVCDLIRSFCSRTRHEIDVWGLEKLKNMLEEEVFNTVYGAISGPVLFDDFVAGLLEYIEKRQ